ncbi:MAG: hypothetical protein AAGH41_07020 [Pseudomonadota bacterium]
MTDLRLSAMRAFLGQITPTMRRISCWMDGSEITVSVVMDREPTEKEIDRISVAATEIIADYPQATNVHERITVSEEDFAAEAGVKGDIIFERAEDDNTL